MGVAYGKMSNANSTLIRCFSVGDQFGIDLALEMGASVNIAISKSMLESIRQSELVVREDIRQQAFYEIISIYDKLNIRRPDMTLRDFPDFY